MPPFRLAVPSLRLGVIACCLGLALAGCGRRGGLEDPGTRATGPTSAGQSAAAGQTPAGYSGHTTPGQESTSATTSTGAPDADGTPAKKSKAPARQRHFFLDPLI
ncbi:lipoprotein [Faunimonas pinastri]|nr:lipoprotein [Faunimonas pinastri]